MIIFPQLLTNWGFNVGLKGGQITGGVATDTVKTGLNTFTDFSNRLKNNILLGGIFIIVIMVLGLKIINRITK